MKLFLCIWHLLWIFQLPPKAHVPGPMHAEQRKCNTWCRQLHLRRVPQQCHQLHSVSITSRLQNPGAGINKARSPEHHYQGQANAQSRTFNNQNDSTMDSAVTPLTVGVASTCVLSWFCCDIIPPIPRPFLKIVFPRAMWWQLLWHFECIFFSPHWNLVTKGNLVSWLVNERQRSKSTWSNLTWVIRLLLELHYLIHCQM